MRRELNFYQKGFSPGSNWRKTVLYPTAVLIALITLWALFPIRAQLASHINALSDQASIQATIQQWGLWGPIALGFLQFLQVLVAVLPGQGLYLASGYLYGPIVGGALSFAVTVAASQLAFALARHGGQAVVDRLAPGAIPQRFFSFIDRYGGWFFLIAFFIPVAPADALNFAAGLSPIRWRTFFIASLIGRLPGAFGLAFVGSLGWVSLKTVFQSPIFISVLLLVAVLMLVLVYLNSIQESARFAHDRRRSTS